MQIKQKKLNKMPEKENIKDQGSMLELKESERERDRAREIE